MSEHPVSGPLPSEWQGGEPALHLHCPVCGHQDQHHVDVSLFMRPGGEDRPSVLLRGGVVTPTGDNPSPRREAICIAFAGECGHDWWLDIIQHKGQTFVVARSDS